MPPWAEGRTTYPPSGLISRDAIVPRAAVQILHLTPLPLGGLDIADLTLSTPRVRKMTLAHVSGDDAFYK